MKFLAKLSKKFTFSPFPSYGSKIKEDEARLSAFSQAEMPLPKRLIIAGTFQCNARCPHCYMLQQNKEMFKEQNIMADLLFKKIMTSPFIKSLKRVTFSGGEALLNPNIFDWIDQAEKSGIKKIAIITNGLRLQDNKTVEKLLEKKNLSGFNISLDAISKEKYCRAKGIKDCDFDLICKQISRISDKFRGTSTKITSLLTDLTDGNPGSMLETYFQEKEGEWYSFIRTNANTVNWQMRSANGLGVCTGVTGPNNATIITFLSSIGSITNIGDTAYAATLTAGAATAPPVLAGQITGKTSTSITIDTTGVGGTVPTVGQFIMAIKDSVAESHGARGYYLQFTLQNDSTNPVELFSVGSSVMKSFPGVK